MRDGFRMASAATLLLLPWIFFDIDLGDQAFSSVSSWLLAFHPRASGAAFPVWFEVSPVWFSLFVGSLWWKVIGWDAPHILVRAGWLLWNVGVCLVLFSLVRRFYPGKKAVGAFLLGLLAVVSAADLFVLSYNLVAPALGALAIALFAQSVRGNGARKVDGWAFASGIPVVLAVVARMPVAIFVPPFFLCALVLEVYLTGFSKKLLFRYCSLGLGLLAGLLVAYACLVISQQDSYFLPALQSFFGGFGAGQNDRYTKATVILRSLGHYQKIFVGAVLFALSVAAISLAGRARLVAQVVVALIFTGLACTKYGLVMAVVIGGSVAILALRAWQLPREERFAKIILFMGALWVMAAFVFGTNLEGLQNFKYGLWLLVPIAFLEADYLRLPRVFTNASRAILAVAVLALFFCTRLLWPTFPYLERTIFSMRTAFAQPALATIYSYPEKVEALDGVVAELNRRGLKANSEFIAYAAEPPYYPIATLYSLTHTIPVLGDPTLVEYPVHRWERNRALLEAKAKNGELPPLVVRQWRALPHYNSEGLSLPKRLWQNQISTFSAENFQWGTATTGPLAKELDDILRQAGYQPVWRNGYFVILAKP